MKSPRCLKQNKEPLLGSQFQLETGFSFGGIVSCTLPPAFSQTSHFPSVQSPENGSDPYWLLEAFRESHLSSGISNPNPAVGCVIVDQYGKKLASGFTQTYGSLHAERVALKQVSDPSALQNATAYVTLEPCSHTGHQPPCAGALVSSPIRRVVISRPDPNPVVDGAGLQLLRNSGKEVSVGLYQNEVTAWNFSFFAHFALKRPLIVLKWAQTLDGQLADDRSISRWISGPMSRSYTHWLRQRYDAILVGAGTVLADFPNLNVRDCSSPHQHQPYPIIFDPEGLCLSLNQEKQKRLLETTFNQSRRCAYFTTNDALQKHPNNWLNSLGHIPFFILPGTSLIEELVELIQSKSFETELGRPLQSIFVEGGPRTFTSFLKAGYADLIHVFIAPIITGGINHRIQLFENLDSRLDYLTLSSFRLGQDTVLELVPTQLASMTFPQSVN